MGSIFTGEICMNEDKRAKAIEEQLRREKEEIRLLQAEWDRMTAQNTSAGEPAEKERELKKQTVEIEKAKEDFQAQTQNLQKKGCGISFRSEESAENTRPYEMMIGCSMM